MLTARAAGIVLRNISQVDSFKAEWMEEYFTKVRHIGTSKGGTGRQQRQVAAARTACSGPVRCIQLTGHIGAAAACVQQQQQPSDS
jgi:dissimilatory sulfite reductase (desulfoviridin) alpha/beta subunit